MIEKLFAEYLENPMPETSAAYDSFMAALDAQEVKIDDEALSAYTLVLEQSAYQAGFSAAVALMAEAATIQRKAG